MTKKTCCRCRILKPIDEFYRQTSASDGFCSRCKVCESVRGGHKKKVSAQRKLPDVQLAYLAGLVDGEGFIGLVKPRKPDDRHLVHARMCITNTNPNLLLVAEQFGFGKVYSIPAKNNKHKDRKDWYIRSGEMKWLLPQLVKYLLLKRRQAELLLEYFSLVRNKSELYKARVMEIYLSLRVLNHRGKS